MQVKEWFSEVDRVYCVSVVLKFKWVYCVGVVLRIGWVYCVAVVDMLFFETLLHALYDGGDISLRISMDRRSA